MEQHRLIERPDAPCGMLSGSQLPVDQWYATIGDNTLADAILDRLIHNAHRLTLKGESMRKKQAAIDSS